MNYGLYLSAGGALTSMYRQDVLANNLANLNTVGFKPDIVTTIQRLPERIEDGSFADPQWMLERLGGGVLAGPTRVSLSQGNLITTENPLDVAFEGEGLFVVGDGRNTDPATLRFTRDGRFTLNADRELVMSTTGLRVLDDRNRPITLDPSQSVRIDAEGRLFQNGRSVGRINIVEPPDPSDLIKAGENLLRLAENIRFDSQPATGRLRQGFTESSAVDPIKTLNSLIDASRAAQGNLRMMQYQDNALGQMFNTFGRVA
jgi:flagellar basal body rod protein FlgG